MYSQDEIVTALRVYHDCGSVSKTTCVLGYPTRRTLYGWIAQENCIKPSRKVLSNINTAAHPRNPSLEAKLGALHRCFEEGESIKTVSEDICYTRTSIYNWRKQYLKGGIIALLNDKNIKPNRLVAGTTASTLELKQLRAELHDMQMEIDILKETINVLKKDPCIDQTILRNKEKAVIVDALQKRYSLPMLLNRLTFSKSSYYYQKATKRKQDKYMVTRRQISEVFHESKDCYGYRRVHGKLKREG